eukprot:5341145-Pyramimonas_sp.AAC.1
MLASAVKAASCKNLCIFIGQVAHEYCDGSDHDKLVVCCMQALSEWICCMDDGGHWFRPELKEKCVHWGNLYNICHQKLACDALAKDVCLWKVRTKIHDLCHTVDRIQADSSNPKYTQCIHDESMLGKFKKIARKCHRLTLSARFLQRWLIQFTRELKL